MRTEQLIADLARGATRVTPVKPPSMRFVAWCGVAVASAVLAVLFFGFRRNLDAVVMEPWFIASAVLVIAVAATAAFTALVLAVPGAEGSPSLRSTAFSLLSIWVVLSVSGVLRAGNGLTDASDWYVCFVRVIAIGLAPAWVLFGMLRRAFPLRRRTGSSLAALGAMAVGSATIQFVCPLDVPSHGFLGHLIPALALCALAVGGSRALIPKSQFPTPK